MEKTDKYVADIDEQLASEGFTFYDFDGCEFNSNVEEEMKELVELYDLKVSTKFMGDLLGSINSAISGLAENIKNDMVRLYKLAEKNK